MKTETSGTTSRVWSRPDGWLTAFLALLLAGCGIIEAPLPNLAVDLSLTELRQIQLDPLLTVAEKREKVRILIGAPNDAGGDRIVNFLLALPL
jgi:hypothetical protein